MSVQVPKGYKQTEVGVIPEDWPVKKLSELASFRTGPFGSALHKSDYITNGVPVINPMHIIDGQINPSEDMTITEDTAKKLSEFRLTSGEVVIGRRGDMGRCAVVRKENDGWLCGTGSMIVRPKNHINPQFLQRVLASPSVIAAIEETSVGSTMINLNQSTLGGLWIQAPSAAEQQAIAEALSDADALIESLEQLIAKKRQIKQGAMQELLTGQRRLPGFSGEWVRRSLDEVADVIDPHPSHRAPNEVPNGIPFLGIGDFDENGNIVGKKLRFVDPSVLEEHAGRYCLDDALIGLGRVASIGKVVSLKKHDDGYAISPTLGVIRGRDVGRDFLIYSLKSSFVKDQFLKIMSGSTRSSVGMQVLRELIIELPPSKEEQNSIATCLKDMDYEIEILDMRLDKARQIKQSMMQELLTGRIRLI